MLTFYEAVPRHPPVCIHSPTG